MTDEQYAEYCEAKRDLGEDPLTRAQCEEFARITIAQAFRDTVNRDHPMGAARIVRREMYAWPGGYPLVLVMDDGAVLCPVCVASEYRQISQAHREKHGNGWKPMGLMIIEAEEDDVTCAHCDALIYEAD